MKGGKILTRKDNYPLLRGQRVAHWHHFQLELYVQIDSYVILQLYARRARLLADNDSRSLVPWLEHKELEKVVLDGLPGLVIPKNVVPHDEEAH